MSKLLIVGNRAEICSKNWNLIKRLSCERRIVVPFSLLYKFTPGWNKVKCQLDVTKFYCKVPSIHNNWVSVVVLQLVNHATYFGRFIRPSSGLQNNTAVHGTIRTVHTTHTAALKTTTLPKTRCKKPYAATQHLMLLMMGVCARNMSS